MHSSVTFDKVLKDLSEIVLKFMAPRFRLDLVSFLKVFLRVFLAWGPRGLCDFNGSYSHCKNFVF